MAQGRANNGIDARKSISTPSRSCSHAPAERSWRCNSRSVGFREGQGWQSLGHGPTAAAPRRLSGHLPVARRLEGRPNRWHAGNASRKARNRPPPLAAIIWGVSRPTVG